MRGKKSCPPKPDIWYTGVHSSESESESERERERESRPGNTAGRFIEYE